MDWIIAGVAQQTGIWLVKFAVVCIGIGALAGYLLF